jgi:hypothetical protein
MFPIIPILAWLAVICGGGTLIWYSNLPPHKQEEADELMADFAIELYNKKLDELNASQAKTVHEMARRHFDN